MTGRHQTNEGNDLGKLNVLLPLAIICILKNNNFIYSMYQIVKTAKIILHIYTGINTDIYKHFYFNIFYI